MAELRGPVGAAARQLRAHQWWNHKVPVVLATAYTVMAAGSPASAPRLLVDAALFLIAVVGVAGFGHVVNDIFDRVPDMAAGKANTTKDMTSSRLAVLVGGLLVVSLLPWIWLPHPAAAMGLLGAEILLLLVYAAPPIRLKDRGSLGAMADALYGFVLPIALTAATFGRLANPGLGRAAFVLVVVWAAALGVRGILVHQLEDLDADRAAGTSTWAGRMGAARSQRVISVVLPVDVGALVALMIVLRTAIPWAPYVLAAFIVFRAVQVSYFWPEPLAKGWYSSAEGVSHVVGFVFLNEFTSYWYPVLAVATVTFRRPELAPLLVAHLVLFHTPLRDVRPLLGLVVHWSALGIARATRSRIRQAPAPLLGIAYVALALSTRHLPRWDAIERLAAAAVIVHGLAWFGRTVGARSAEPPDDRGDFSAGDPDSGRRDPTWPAWSPIAGAVLLVVAGSVAQHSLAATLTCLGLASVAMILVVTLPAVPQVRPGWLVVEVVARVGLPALICWRVVLDEPGVRAHSGLVVVAFGWLLVTSARGVSSRILSEAWVRDWLPDAGINPATIERRRAAVTRLLLPLDLAGLAGVGFVVGRGAPGMLALFVVFVPWCLEATRRRRGGAWETEGDTRTKTLHRPVVAVLGEFAEQWFAWFALGAAVTVHPSLWPLIPLHLVLVGGPVDLVIAAELRDRATGPLAFVAEQPRPPIPRERTAAQNSV